ncbi:MAG: hypothetical protein CVV51_07240 [Spirochaetae bacterium HGW-Spirochaetae-7]|jgi:hypothetical protein|nr:MAG: hypothetical protein CVV51_07240 [Spirochaetae bacterium HGW-Spirochaetae-7]
MEQLLNEIRIAYIDSAINQTLLGITDDARNVPYGMRFNQGEEYFIELGSPLFVPKLPIHHDIRRPVPDADYATAINGVVSQLATLLSECFSGLTYFFDPAEILKPCFYRLYKAENEVYLYLLRVDLLPRPFDAEIMETGTNDVTQSYSTKRLYLETELIPLEAVMWESGRVKAFRIRQMISQTWIGETGKGYLVRGIWMDTDLSKYFTKLFLPTGKRIYPFFPLYCKYKTICATAPILTSAGRRALIPLLHRAVKFLQPEIAKIQEILRDAKFSEALPDFIALRNRVPESWKVPLVPFSIESYLNEREQKEYALDYGNDTP